jgi:hypothetical protein
MAKVRKLTSNRLKQLVMEEKQKLDSKAREVKAKDMAGTLANKVDYLKALKIHESKLAKKLKRVMKEKARVKSQIMKEL